MYLQYIGFCAGHCREALAGILINKTSISKANDSSKTKPKYQISPMKARAANPKIEKSEMVDFRLETPE